MNLRVPLYAKILSWFFLNLLLLAVVFLFLAHGQFRSGFNWILATGADRRIQAVSAVIMAELNGRPRGDWTDVLKRFDKAYGLQFLLFRNDGTQIAGDPLELPPEVHARLTDRRGPLRRRPPRDEPLGAPPVREPGLPAPEAQEPPPPQLPPPPGGRARFMVRTEQPTRYWVLTRAAINAPGLPRPLPATLIIVSDSLSGGGLFFDFRPWVAVGLGAVLVSALLWLPFIRGITRSIGQMTHATRQIAEGRFDGRVDERRRDELGLLGQSINRMASRLAGFVGGQKRFLGDIAHELCSPIARIQVALGILEQRADEKQKGYVDDLRDEVEHMSNLVNELLSFSKASLGAPTLKVQPVALRTVVERAVDRERTDHAQIQVEIADDLVALAEPELLLRSLANLLRNAARYAGDAGPITVSARREGEDIQLTVSDCGPGVPETELAQIFDPFYRLDTSRDAGTGGVGLGLAIVKTCVESCGGTVTCHNRRPSGLEVRVMLRSATGQAPGP